MRLKRFPRWVLFQALPMPELEQRERMRSMRALIRDFNVYGWAGKMLLDAARIRRREEHTARLNHEWRDEIR